MRAFDLRLPAALAVAIIVAGCGLTDPYTSQHTTTTKSAPTGSTSNAPTATNADPAPERGGTIPKTALATQSKPAANAAKATPQAALERYADLDINWTARTVAGVQEQLAALSVGQARAQALQAAASYRRDTTLLSSQVANSGAVIAIAAGQGPANGWWVIVTRETTTGQGDYAGLPPTDHVTDAQVQPIHDGFVVSAWSPQT